MTGTAGSGAAPPPARHEVVGLALVAVQLVLLGALAVLGLVPALRQPAWDPGAPASWLLTGLGLLLVVVGGAGAVAGLLGLGSALRASPVPARAGDLRTDGAYRWVRHPVYTGLLAATAGWVLVVRTLPVLAVAVALALLLWGKAAWEESLLARRYAGYAAYAARTPRFVPRRPRPQDAS